MIKLSSLYASLRRLHLLKEASAVASLNWISRSPYFSEIDVGHFLSQNSDELERIDALSGGRFFFAKSGAEGTAYFIGDDQGSPKYVLKIDFLGSTHKLLENSEWEAKVMDSGIFTAKYQNGKEAKLVWKVLEKLATDGVEGSGIQDIIDIALQAIAEIYREILLEEETVDWKKDSIRMMQIDALNHNVIEAVVDYYNQSSRDLVQDLKSKILDEIGSTQGVESAIPALSSGWFDDFISSIIRLLQDGKNDFGEGNVGVREETGRLIWFDA